MKVLEETENKLLNRKEVKIIVEAAKNPSLPDASKILAEKFKSSEELIAVNGVKGKFGRSTFLISGNIYKTKEDKEQVEQKPKEKKAAPGAK